MVRAGGKSKLMSQVPPKPPIIPPGALRRGLIVAGIVGPILALINHGDAIFSGNLTRADALRIAATFLVPFCVSCVSSCLASQERSRHLSTTANANLNGMGLSKPSKTNG